MLSCPRIVSVPRFQDYCPMHADVALNTPALQRLIDAIASSGKIRRQEYFHLTSALLNLSVLSEGQPVQISQIFDEVLAGKCELID
jgi:hypothetical protein